MYEIDGSHNTAIARDLETWPKEVARHGLLTVLCPQFQPFAVRIVEPDTLSIGAASAHQNEILRL